MPDLKIPPLGSTADHIPIGDKYLKWVQRAPTGLYTLSCDIPGGLAATLVCISVSMYGCAGRVVHKMSDLLLMEIVNFEDGGQIARPGRFQVYVDYSTNEEHPARLPHVIVRGRGAPADPSSTFPAPAWPLLAPSFARLFASLAHPEVVAMMAASKEPCPERPKRLFTRREALARNRVKPKNWWEK